MLSVCYKKKKKKKKKVGGGGQSKFGGSLIKFRALKKYVIMTFSLQRILDAKKYYDKKSPKILLFSYI